MKPYWSSPDGRIALYLGDCRDLMATLADKSIDVVITDPPYSEHVHAKSRSGSKRGGNISKAADFGFGALTPELREACADHFARLAKRWTLIFSDIESTHLWLGEMTAAGVEFVRTGVWVKGGATPQFTGDRPAAGVEAITIVHPAGKKRWNGGGKHAVWNAQVVNGQADEARIHTTQKPVKLMRQLVADFSDPDELILDPFAGGATTLVAAYEQGRRAIGCELDEANAEKAACRLDALVKQGALFPFDSTPAASIALTASEAAR